MSVASWLLALAPLEDFLDFLWYLAPLIEEVEDILIFTEAWTVVAAFLKINESLTGGHGIKLTTIELQCLPKPSSKPCPEKVVNIRIECRVHVSNQRRDCGQQTAP